MAAGGYPDGYDKGYPISGLEEANSGETRVFHAGTSMDDDAVITSGGRVLCVCALGDSVTSAAKSAYAGCEKVNWQGAFFRPDIGYRAIARESLLSDQTKSS
jgi:phosphoribosylamine--glycine ligase